MRLPLEPLEALARGRSDGSRPWSTVQLAEVLGVPRRTLLRWRAKGGLPWTQADRLACRINVHPAVVWPDEWAAVLASKRGVTIHPRRRNLLA